MRKTRQLMSSFQLCLAHYCDLHGPTPLMVTEGLPASCTVCFEDGIDPAEARPRSSAHATGPTSQSSAALNDALKNLNLSRSSSVPASEQEAQAQRAALLRSSSSGAAATPSAIDTPPDSPRPVPPQHSRRDSSFRRTYDETVTKKQGPCDNCAMTLPPRQQGGSNNVHFANNARGPTLRTRAPAERVFGAGGQASPPNSQTSSDTDGERDEDPRSRTRMTPSVSSRNTSRSSASGGTGGNSNAADRTPFHVHYVDYTSTHDPVLPDSFSLIRASCLRTLSFETLPRAPATASPTSPISATSPAFVTTQSAGSAVTGGPIFFGDALAGYTTAYIFRIPDVHARGHKRVYAFLALSTHRERLAMKTFAVVSAVFRDLATWIQQLAEAEAERAAEASPIGSNMYGGGCAPQPSAVESTGGPDRGGSSFLTGGSGFTRRMGGGPGASAPKARGLAEIVGQPDIFIELHRRFVHLLFEVGVTLSS
ncbi:golgi to plasma membrane transport vesicle coat [Fusarium albosuccineum]|uniref:Golgi to plasma membrane transport vesicle coat n=1 Tax=Fusarium albosuccineum TaxID=1237068 RepID=A0A8H4LH67_9HYPO|nr:golgi to plasma membrane transport vesicle coat [Fusarium albosuccineum]